MSTSYLTKAKQSTDYELTAACWHEASHAICGLFNYMKIYHVYVRSNQDEHGKTLYEMYDLSLIKNKLLAKIILIYEVQTLYAGLVGEKMYYKDICGSDRFPMHLRIGSSGDMQEASRLIEKYNLAPPGKARFLFKKQAHKEAKNILSEHWSDTKLLAHTLYRHKELKFDDLKFFLTRRSQKKEFWKHRFSDIEILYADIDNLELDEKHLKNVLCNTILIM